ncbi:hypothetical protein PL586_14020 [Phocaeicola vulgatus]|nr:hypothetical protein [Phocaeicola vulgatus]
MFDDLRLDVVKNEIHFSRLPTFPFRPIAFRIPNVLWNALFATELGDSSVDGYSSHDGNNSVFLFASVYIEDYLECTSHNSTFLFGAKLVYENWMTEYKIVQNAEVQTVSIKSALAIG